MSVQPPLPLPVPGACGYCRGALTLQPGGDAACDHCRSALAQISTVGEWIDYHRATRKARCSTRRPTGDTAP